jgi:YidC/Oxa1 family membrane protein insertase
MYLYRALSAVPAESSLVHVFGAIFHPLFVVLATLLAAIYGLTASYGVAIVVLTVVIMALLMPLTISSIRSMVVTQRLQPKLRDLQHTYEGAENRDRLHHETMRLYKEEGFSPAAGCLAALLQLPILVVLYDVIRGLNNTLVTVVRGHAVTVAMPRYIPTSSRMHHSLVASHGAMNWLGINLALKPLSAHAQWFGILPYLALILVAVGLQYVQLAQVRKSNPAAPQRNSPLQRVQKLLPALYACVYLVIPGAVVLYTIVSTIIRIGIQRVLLRNGGIDPQPIDATG